MQKDSNSDRLQGGIVWSIFVYFLLFVHISLFGAAYESPKEKGTPSARKALIESFGLPPMLSINDEVNGDNVGRKNSLALNLASLSSSIGEDGRKGQCNTARGVVQGLFLDGTGTGIRTLSTREILGGKKRSLDSIFRNRSDGSVSKKVKRERLVNYILCNIIFGDLSNEGDFFYYEVAKEKLLAFEGEKKAVDFTPYLNMCHQILEQRGYFQGKEKISDIFQEKLFALQDYKNISKSIYAIAKEKKEVSAQVFKTIESVCKHGIIKYGYRAKKGKALRDMSIALATLNKLISDDESFKKADDIKEKCFNQYLSHFFDTLSVQSQENASPVTVKRLGKAIAALNVLSKTENKAILEKIQFSKKLSCNVEKNKKIEEIYFAVADEIFASRPRIKEDIVALEGLRDLIQEYRAYQTVESPVFSPYVSINKLVDTINTLKDEESEKAFTLTPPAQRIQENYPEDVIVINE